MCKGVSKNSRKAIDRPRCRDSLDGSVDIDRRPVDYVWTHLKIRYEWKKKKRKKEKKKKEEEEEEEKKKKKKEKKKKTLHTITVSTVCHL
ncbi:hypothetical protein M8J77_000807 [Diaphorina citri]|nr:hypothetical protein M8J77_000807 [Diaphorina citri]